MIERPTGDWGPPPAEGEEMFSFDELTGRDRDGGRDVYTRARASFVEIDPERFRVPAD